MLKKTTTIKNAKLINQTISIKNECDVPEVLEMLNLKEVSYAFRNLRNEYLRIFDITLSIAIIGTFPRNTDVVFGYVGKGNGGSLIYACNQSRTGGLSDILSIYKVSEIIDLQKKLGITENDTIEISLGKVIKGINEVVSNRRVINDICGCCEEILKLLE